MAELTVDIAIQSLNLLRAVVSKRVTLDKNDFGCCPFHDDKTPSFHLFVARSGRARFHCFGCQETGDIFNFLSKIEKLPFRAALSYLAALTNREPGFFLPEQPESYKGEVSDAKLMSMQHTITRLQSKIDRLAYLARCVRTGYPEKIHEAFDQLEPEDFN